MSQTNQLSRTKQLMNTSITISVVKDVHSSTVGTLNAIDSAFGEFDRVVAKFTRFNQNSELANLNRNSGNWTQVSQELFDLVRYMLELAEITDGAFDPTIIDFLEAYGYDPNYDFSKLDNPDLDKLVANRVKTRPSWKEIELNPENHSLRLAPDQRIDLGGIGKGYAIDLAHAKLADLQHSLIDAGGDVRATGLNQHGNPWQLGLLHQDAKGHKSVIGTTEVTNMAVACSGSWARKVKQFHHLINPSSGTPVQHMHTVYVTAPTAMQADAWATALFVGGKQLLIKLPKGVEAALITDTGVTVTRGFVGINAT